MIDVYLLLCLWGTCCYMYFTAKDTRAYRGWHLPKVVRVYLNHYMQGYSCIWYLKNENFYEKMKDFIFNCNRYIVKYFGSYLVI